MAKKSILPRKASELIRLALSDLKEAVDNGLNVDMDSWVTLDARTQAPCNVCLAGAVMVCQFDQSEFTATFYGGKLELSPGSLKNDDDAMALSALDKFARGKIHLALSILRRVGEPEEYSHLRKRWDVHPFHLSPDRFYTDMEKMAVYLEGKGF